MLAQVQLLFIVVFLEMSLILLFLFKTPLRKLIIMTLDRVKRGRGPLIVKSVAATVLVIMIYTVYSIRELQSRPTDTVNPTDQILLAHQILQAALMDSSNYCCIRIKILQSCTTFEGDAPDNIFQESKQHSLDASWSSILSGD